MEIINLPAEKISEAAQVIGDAFENEGFAKIVISGVYLFTSDEKNKILYERLGYRTFYERDLGSIIAYHMFYALHSSS